MEKRDMIVGGVLVVLALLFISNNNNLSGHASKAVKITRELGMDEYSFQLGLPMVIEGKRITLITIGDSNEVIVDVGGVQKGISEYQTRVVNGLQIENVVVGDYNAVLRIINLEAGEDFCLDSDDGDIYVKGKCEDRFYPEGVRDFCDFSYLREYNCGYDAYIDEVHCLKHVVECGDGCRKGACVVK